MRAILRLMQAILSQTHVTVSADALAGDLLASLAAALA